MLQFYDWGKVLLYMKELEEGSVVFIDLHPSDVCNQNCVWCRYARSHSQLSWNDLMSILEKYPKVRGIVAGGGGEPLTNKNIPRFIEECGKRGIATGIYTNGSLLDDDSINAIGNNCRFCRISLDAACKETHTLLHRCSPENFDRILDNVRRLRKTPLPELGLSYLVVPENGEEIPMLAELDLPIDYVHFKPLIQGIDEDTRKKSIENVRSLEKRVSFRVKYDRLFGDLLCDHSVPCRISRLIRVIAADKTEYVCCEHDGEEEFLIGKWDGSSMHCRTCRYVGYNQVLHAYASNSMAKELL